MDNAEDQNVIESGAETNTGIDHTLEPVANPATEKNVDNQTPSDESGTNEITANQLGCQEETEAKTSDALHEQSEQKRSENKAETHHAPDSNADSAPEKQSDAVVSESDENEQRMSSDQSSAAKHHERTDLHVFLAQRAAMRRRRRQHNQPQHDETPTAFEPSQTNTFENAATSTDSQVNKQTDTKVSRDVLVARTPAAERATQEPSQSSAPLDNVGQQSSNAVESETPQPGASTETSPSTDSSKEAPQPDNASAFARFKHTASSIHNRLEPVRSALTTGYHKFRSVWDKRWKFSYVLYAVVFVLITAASTIGLQWSVYSDPEYPEGTEVDATTKAAQSVAGQLTHFVSKMWLEHQFQFLLNFLVLGLIYIVLIVVINRFWVSTAIFGSIMAVYAVANSFKVQLREEPVIPADLNFVSGGNTGEIMSFVSDDQMPFVTSAIHALLWFIAICIVLQFLDHRNAFIPTYWKHPIAHVKNIAGNITRVVAVVVSVSLLFSFTWNLSTPNTRAQQWAASLNDYPQLWDAMGDATSNGPAMNFLRLTHTKIMDKPSGYSKESMQKIAAHYRAAAKSINETRNNKITDNTVIMILSESFSDPLRVPGIGLSEDPIPFIRSLKTQTTSGLALSTGYGGGTANIEYQALTGLSMANYSPSLSIAYQQLVPKEKWAPTFNQIWNQENGASSSQAFHTYMKNMYFRDVNYKKFGFYKFWSMDGTNTISNCTALDSVPFLSDQCLYDNILQQLNDQNLPKSGQFIQGVSVQNHVPYNNWYQDNQFIDADVSSNITDEERTQVETYAKGINQTDQATAQFLASLNEIEQPVTVIFYGDHLPGIYSTASAQPENTLGLHETDYFIWSNHSSSAHDTKLSDEKSGYTSSNYFMAQAAEHMNAKVSPYLAFLTQMHHQIPAISVPSAGGNNKETPVFLNDNGEIINNQELNKTARQLLHDYQFIQYDISAGKNYLLETNFMDID